MKICLISPVIGSLVLLGILCLGLNLRITDARRMASTVISFFQTIKLESSIYFAARIGIKMPKFLMPLLPSLIMSFLSNRRKDVRDKNDLCTKWCILWKDFGPKMWSIFLRDDFLGWVFRHPTVNTTFQMIFLEYSAVFTVSQRSPTSLSGSSHRL